MAEESVPKTDVDADAAPEASDKDEAAAKALADARVISDDEMKEAVGEHKRTGKAMKSILSGSVILDRMRRMLKTPIRIGGLSRPAEKHLTDALKEAGWVTDDQIDEAVRHAEESGHALGRILVDRGIITMEQLQGAVERQKETGHTLSRTLLNLGYAMPKEVSDALWAERSLPGFSMKREEEEIGKMLVARHLLTRKKWDAAWEGFLNSGKPFVDYMIEHDVATEAQLAQVMAEHSHLPFVDLDERTINEEAIRQLPAALIQENKTIPFDLTDGEIHVAAFEPTQVDAFDTIGAMASRRVVRYLAPRSQVLAAIAKYAPVTKAPGAVSEVKTEAVPGERIEDSFSRLESDLLAGRDAETTTQLVKKMVEGAVNARATDIHLDPQENVMRVRYRVDGMLHDAMNLPIGQAPHIVSRIKVMANMNIVDRHHAQDGHISTMVRGRNQDLRVASVPTSLGEKVTIRIMDPTNVLTGLSQLGFDGAQLELMHGLIRKPYGLILATGPVGSGKTTTLYSCLNQVNVLEKNVMTIEDPVEYRLRGTNQIQVDPVRHFGFADGLKALLRQDPNIIMVGEIRDTDTAQTAVRASLTGVLVFSTMHANDAPGTVSTLFNHGVPGFLVANSLAGVVAQRLVRKVCAECMEEYRPDEEMLRQMKVRRVDPETLTFARGRGCDACFHTGYRGRTGTFEVMEVDEEIKDLVFRQTTREVIRQVAIDMGMQTLKDSAFKKVCDRETTVEEYFRVVFV